MDIELLKADLERATGVRAPEQGETMAQSLARLDACARPETTPEPLKHYLSRRSYVKALAWLEDPSIPHER
jgi:hypothetical protein